MKRKEKNRKSNLAPTELRQNDFLLIFFLSFLSTVFSRRISVCTDIHKALINGKAIEAATIQLFTSNQRQ
ncbi:hypothetical protein EDM02_02740 [Candidatus Cardinium hertigii]|uniref:Uncharacterized protein n=1 Tax=Candidatus Cardinium hertigii TaxID=247481 RepID=A0A3N2QBZ4_9BACT|nr:hypothetical protein EDM02_02740 [Candidatus Cardinium hertigii]